VVQLFSHHARENIDDAARCIRIDDAQRLGRPFIGSDKAGNGGHAKSSGSGSGSGSGKGLTTIDIVALSLIQVSAAA